MRQAERDHVVAAQQAKIDRAQRIEEERIAKLNEEPEIEIPAFLRGYKDDNKGFVGGAWNNNTDVAYNKHSNVDKYDNGASRLPMKKSSSSQFTKPNISGSAQRNKSHLNRLPSGNASKAVRNQQPSNHGRMRPPSGRPINQQNSFENGFENQG